MAKDRERVILHCDCNSFYASVESIDHLEYRNVPMAVAGDPASRHGIILAKNELAKKYNIQTTDTVWQAKKKCPDLLLVPPHYDLYEEVCEKINHIYEEYTDRVEPFSIDESWLDVTESIGLFGSGEEIANTLRKRIREEIGVTISVGVSFNKTFAKMGSDYKKPDATTVITRENFKEVLWPLPVGDLMFVGKAAQEEFQKYQIYTIGDLANFDEKKIQILGGKAGLEVWRTANGLDDSEVALAWDYHEPKSISHSRTYDHDLTDAEEVKTSLLILADMVGARLRRHGFYAQVISVQVKDNQLKVKQRQQKQTHTTNTSQEIYQVAWKLVQEIWKEGSPIRLLGIGVTQFHDEPIQELNLRHHESSSLNPKQEKLESTMDKIRQRFGEEKVGFARSQKKRNE